MRVAKIVALLALVAGVGYATYRALPSVYYALRDSFAEKSCSQVLEIDDGRGRTCRLSREQAIDLGGDGERPSDELCGAGSGTP